MWLMGGSPIYWFLPFIYFSFVMLYPIYKILIKYVFLQIPFVLLCLFFSAYLYHLPNGWLNASYDKELWPLRWEKDIPLVPLAAAFSIILEKNWRWVFDNNVAVFFASIFGLMVGIYMIINQMNEAFHLIGFSLTFLGISMPSCRLVELLAPLAKHTFLIYLIHVMVLWPVISIHRSYLGRVTLAIAEFETLLVFILCLTFSYYFRKVHIFKCLVP